jgi:hypothetical protein
VELTAVNLRDLWLSVDCRLRVVDAARERLSRPRNRLHRCPSAKWATIQRFVVSLVVPERA